MEEVTTTLWREIAKKKRYLDIFLVNTLSLTLIEMKIFYLHIEASIGVAVSILYSVYMNKDEIRFLKLLLKNVGNQ